ncbi:hypothetical protein FOA43_003661 [Brettanomyces nanus]|uniref:Protein BTN n=1 Tax=Eeniella nana TaxID=13502 RepID=A0A875S7M3_EENNA|nr:uncharacterized protein FOA43_003661 [Brettanomyces nanus]QPG76275.1 hypothetical protein FOA43_003661 [Brettanomyces nanus]
MSSVQIFSSFWLFGLINNVLYVVILSAAVDLVGPTAPKAIVLMADVLPSFICKLTAPFYIQIIPYHVRIWILAGLSGTGMLIISLVDSLTLSLCGIVLASVSSGLGEITFLQLTHYYTDISLHGWSSGTGGAGLIGSFVFMLLTTIIGISPRTTLLIFSIVPCVLVAAFFLMLPSRSRLVRNCPASNEEIQHIFCPTVPIGSTQDISPDALPIIRGEAEDGAEEMTKYEHRTFKDHILVTVERIKPYFVPYMGPLFTVYMAEYIINQGISPTLLFPLKDMPFAHFRDAYVTYSTLYQTGVFISRSSGALVKLDHLYIPSLLQVVNLLACVLQSMFMWLPNIYLVFLLVFYEGLLGGLSYVNTFRAVAERTDISEREFAMGCVGMSDSGGIVVAAIFSMFLEPSLCSYQVSNGRPWCSLQ